MTFSYMGVVFSIGGMCVLYWYLIGVV